MVVRLCDSMRARSAMSREWRDVHSVFFNMRALLGVGADRLRWSWFGCRDLNVDLFEGRLSTRLCPTFVYVMALDVGAAQLRIFSCLAGR